MRTTVTLTPEAHALIRKLMRERDMGFKEAVNAAILEGLSAKGERSEFRTPTYDMGKTLVPVEHALRLAAELEDEELVRKRELGK